MIMIVVMADVINMAVVITTEMMMIMMMMMMVVVVVVVVVDIGVVVCYSGAYNIIII